MNLNLNQSPWLGAFAAMAGFGLWPLLMRGDPKSDEEKRLERLEAAAARNASMGEHYKIMHKVALTAFDKKGTGGARDVLDAEAFFYKELVAEMDRLVDEFDVAIEASAKNVNAERAQAELRKAALRATRCMRPGEKNISRAIASVYVTPRYPGNTDAQENAVIDFRAAGFPVHDAENPCPETKEKRFSWAQISPDWEKWSPEHVRDALVSPEAQKALRDDFDAIQHAAIIALVYPASQATLLAVGAAKARGQMVIAIIPEGLKPPLAHGALYFDMVVKTAEEAIPSLAEVFPPPIPVTAPAEPAAP